MKRKLRLHFWVCALLLALFVSAETICTASGKGPAASEYEEPAYLAGVIYARGGKQLLFKFNRTVRRSGSSLKVQRDFTYPDGKLAARERIVYDGDALVSYELGELQIGASGSARIQRTVNNPAKNSIEFEYTAEAGGRPKMRREALRENTLTADMVGPFLASHWAALQRGEKVKCRYIVVPRAETVGFTFLKASEAPRSGQDGLIVKMEPSSPFISALVEPLFFTIEHAPPHRVLQYTGRTTPKIQVGGKWDDLDALTVFDWKSAR
jgi:hypothetical protein